MTRNTVETHLELPEEEQTGRPRGYPVIASLRDHVARRRRKDDRELRGAARQWLKASARNRIDYEVEWLGMPVIQTPEDMVLMQELIFRLRPDVVVETGVAHGGSLVFYASILELLGRGEVIGIDVDIRRHNRRVLESHPLFKRIALIEGDSVSDVVVEAVDAKIPSGAGVLVCLDSDHHAEHVYRELMAYQHLVGVGSYLVVFDTVTSELAADGVCDASYRDNGPMEAIHRFLAEDSRFEVDTAFNKLFVSTSRDGYLRRVR